MFTLITEVHADCFACGEFETIFRDPILHTVYTQLYESVHVRGILHVYKGQNHPRIMTLPNLSKLVSWCFTPSQPVRLYQGDIHLIYLIFNNVYVLKSVHIQF